jgi:hypothetical protein
VVSALVFDCDGVLAITGIMARGSASLGEKTLLDALVPATDSLEAAIGDPAMWGG